MSVTLIFYNNTSENNRVTKKLTSVISMSNCTIKEENEIITPKILVNNTALISANYIYIAELSRYYFITDVKIIRNGLYEYTLKCDVLMTYKTGILNQTAIIKRQENKYNLYLDDEKYKCLNIQDVDIKKFNIGFSDILSYVLIVAGG